MQTYSAVMWLTVKASNKEEAKKIVESTKDVINNSTQGLGISADFEEDDLQRVDLCEHGRLWGSCIFCGQDL